jgi:phospholipid/cholesterol/gamma-HCH transport system substrate-binding protein
MRLPGRSGSGPPPSTDASLDTRVWGRRYGGPHPGWWGLGLMILLAIGSYLAYTKELPWSNPGYTLTATFENAATLRETAPVRIAGVNVGEVIEIESAGDAANVTFTVKDEGLPIHSDAQIEIRPRLFLEGNFFLDLRPGSPSGPELSDGGQIPMTQTSTAVQLDEVLSILSEPQRSGLQRLLEGFGTALTYEPTAEDDVDQDEVVQGETAAESLNDAFKHGGPAGRDSAIVADALHGERPGDLAKMIDSTGVVFQKLGTREEELADLITNLNITAGAFAAESQNLSLSVELLDPTLNETEDSLAALNAALPPLRALAIESRPSFQELPDTIAALTPWLEQTELLLRDEELGGTARVLREAAPGLAQVAASSKDLFPQMELAGLCTTQNLVPAADSEITSDAAGAQFNIGEPNFQELFYTAAQLASAGQPFDGNGPYLRLQPGGGAQFLRAENPGGLPGLDTRNFGYGAEAPIGIQPALPDGVPAFRMDVPCHTNDVPNLNGAAAAMGPPDLVPAP